MAKIGTAHVEIKPVLNEAALEAIVERIADAIESGVALGLERAPSRPSAFRCGVPGCTDRVNHRH